MTEGVDPTTETEAAAAEEEFLQEAALMAVIWPIVKDLAKEAAAETNEE